MVMLLEKTRIHPFSPPSAVDQLGTNWSLSKLMYGKESRWKNFEFQQAALDSKIDSLLHPVHGGRYIKNTHTRMHTFFSLLSFANEDLGRIESSPVA